MIFEVTSTPRETLVWAPSVPGAHALRRELADDGHLVRDADPWDLGDLGMVPEGEHLEFDPARIFNVGIGRDANATLQGLLDSGHSLVWHHWQPNPSRKAWGVAVSSQSRRGANTNAGAAADAPEAAVHFGVPVRGTRGLGLRMSREAYARINKRSSSPRRRRDDNPALWDALDSMYEDAEHRILSDEWCATYQEQALANFDLNMAHFASLDPDEFEQALQRAVSGRRKLTEVTDLTKWDGVPGLYVMVLDEYRQAYVGATDHPGGIKKHWNGTKSFDRLIWGDASTSILSIDSFRALDTTRLFAAKTSRSFDGENPLLERFPPEFMLNRIRGGRDAVRFGALLGVKSVMKTRQFAPPAPDASS